VEVDQVSSVILKTRLDQPTTPSYRLIDGGPLVVSGLNSVFRREIDAMVGHRKIPSA
jgi:hypothetical protein